jgi:hypothetical protein
MDAADEETREVYARYGLAMYFAQVVEHAIVNLMIALRLPQREALTKGDIDQFMDEAFSMTFGRLLKELRRMGQSTQFLQRDLDQARDMRNWLAHRSSETAPCSPCHQLVESLCSKSWTTQRICSWRLTRDSNGSQLKYVRRTMWARMPSARSMSDFFWKCSNGDPTRQSAAVLIGVSEPRARGRKAASPPWRVRDDDNIVWSAKLPE